MHYCWRCRAGAWQGTRKTLQRAREGAKEAGERTEKEWQGTEERTKGERGTKKADREWRMVQKEIGEQKKKNGQNKRERQDRGQKALEQLQTWADGSTSWLFAKSEARCPNCGHMYGQDEAIWICCDRCNTWFDLECVGIFEGTIPSEFACDNCPQTLFSTCITSYTVTAHCCCAFFHCMLLSCNFMVSNLFLLLHLLLWTCRHTVTPSIIM